MKQTGQALSETLVGMLVLVPLLFYLAYIGKHLDVKSTAFQANRYVVWERTIASDSGEWRAGENRKTLANLQTEVQDRFLQDPRAELSTGAPNSENQLWVDHLGAPLVPLDEVRIELQLEGDPSPIGVAGFLGASNSASLVTALAYDGLPLLNQLDGLSNLIGGALDFNLSLNDAGFARANLSLPAVNAPGFVRGGVVQSPQSSTELSRFDTSGAILTDAWVPGSEANFSDRIDGLVVDEIVSLLVFPGTFTFGFFPLFKEGLDGQSPKLSSDSQVIPPRYVDTAP